MKNTKGLIAAPFTPFTANGELNISIIDGYSEWLKNNGVKGVFVNGTTGEGLSLTKQERIQTVEKWKKTAGDSLRIFVHVTHTSLQVSRELAGHAEKTNCDAIATLPPLFFKPDNVIQLVNYCKEVAAAAPNTPFYYYHMPAMSGVHFPMIEFMETAIREIPTFRGLKYTYENLMDFGLCLFHEGKKYDVLFGRDEMLLAGLAIGADGAVGSFYNFLGAFANRIIADFKEGEIAMAQEKQQFLRVFTRVLVKHGGTIATLKSIGRLSGIDCGPARLPLKNLSDAEEAALKSDLEQMGFFNKILK